MLGDTASYFAYGVHDFRWQGFVFLAQLLPDRMPEGLQAFGKIVVFHDRSYPIRMESGGNN